MGTDSEVLMDHAERISALETEFAATKQDLKDIKAKLDELLHLKSKGLGAFWFVSLLISSGLVGVVVTIVNFLNRPHL